jgi:hypothetical protein
VVTTVANSDVTYCDATICDAASDQLDADITAAITAATVPHGDASWYEQQAADCAVAPSCAELAAGESVDADVVPQPGTVSTVQANQQPTTLPSCDYLSGCVDETVAEDEDRYGYLQPWCEEDDAVASQADCYAGRCGGLPVEVPQAPISPTPNVDSTRVTLNHVTDNWTANCGLVTEPLPWMLPASSPSEPVECSGANRSDVIEMDAAAAYDTNQEDVKSEAAVEIETVVETSTARVGSDPDASVSDTVVNDTPVVATAGSLVGLCHDPRHSTGNDVVRWLNRLNDGLGDEVTHGGVRRVVVRKAADEAVAAAQSSTAELAKEKIAAAGPGRELPDPWWATPGVASGSDLFAAYRDGTQRDGASDVIDLGTTDGVAAAGSAVDDTGTDGSDRVVDDKDVHAVVDARDCTLQAARLAAGEWPGCDAYCDEAYDMSWPTSPRHWSGVSDAADGNDAAEVLPAANSEVADDTAMAVGTTAEIAAGEVVAQVAAATSRAAAHATARVVSVAIVIVRDWSVLLDGRTIRVATAPLVARRQTLPSRNKTAASLRTDATMPSENDSGQAETVDAELSPIDREQIWCDAARWPYEDL